MYYTPYLYFYKSDPATQGWTKIKINARGFCTRVFTRISAPSDILGCVVPTNSQLYGHVMNFSSHRPSCLHGKYNSSCQTLLTYLKFSVSGFQKQAYMEPSMKSDIFAAV